MPKFKGKWVARVEQDFEIEAETEDEACALIEEDMNPANVAELFDMQVAEIIEVG